MCIYCFCHVLHPNRSTISRSSNVHIFTSIGAKISAKNGSSWARSLIYHLILITLPVFYCFLLAAEKLYWPLCAYLGCGSTLPPVSTSCHSLWALHILLNSEYSTVTGWSMCCLYCYWRGINCIYMQNCFSLAIYQKIFLCYIERKQEGEWEGVRETKWKWKWKKESAQERTCPSFVVCVLHTQTQNCKTHTTWLRY